DALPDIIAASVRRLPAAQIDKQFRLQCERPTRLFDTHPSTADRIASAKAAADPGVFRGEAPATVLFRNWDDLCRQATYLHYRGVIGERVFNVTFKPAAEMLEPMLEDARSDAALEKLVPRQLLTVLSQQPIFFRAKKIDPPDDVR